MNHQTFTPEQRSRIGTVGVLLAALVSGVSTGQFDRFAVMPAGDYLGWIVGLGLVVTWYLLYPEYTYAVGHLAMGTVFASVGLEWLVAMEVGLSLVLLGPVIDGEHRVLVPLAFFGVAVSVVAVASVRQTSGLLALSVLLAASIVLPMMVLHRYEFVNRTLAEQRQ